MDKSANQHAYIQSTYYKVSWWGFPFENRSKMKVIRFKNTSDPPLTIPELSNNLLQTKISIE